MATHTFPCPFCGKKMGVGQELLGRKVRCPSCTQVLVAPAPAVVPVAPPPPPPPVAVVTPLPPPAEDLPVFKLPSAESRESIFGENVDEGDDVFSSSELRVPEVPIIPPLEPEAAPAVVQPVAPPPEAAPTVTVVEPVAPPPPVPVLVPTPVADDPWGAMEAAPAPFTEPDKPKPRKKEDDDRPVKRSRSAPAGAGNPLFKVGFFILAPYALIVTVLAVYWLFLKSSAPPGHPLATVPDNFGEYGPAERRKTGKLTVPVDGELPADQRVALGSKLEIGQVEIEPLGVEQRRLLLTSESKGGQKAVETTATDALVLKLRIKNTSDDLTLHPLDPAFNRQSIGTERIATGLVVGKQTFWGGAIRWPWDEQRVARRYEAAQEAEATPLKPGESRDYFVTTDAKPSIVKAVNDATGPLLWRVQVRRGRIDFNGKDVPVTAIIGVEFKSSDVKQTAS